MPASKPRTVSPESDTAVPKKLTIKANAKEPRPSVFELLSSAENCDNNTKTPQPTEKSMSTSEKIAYEFENMEYTDEHEEGPFIPVKGKRRTPMKTIIDLDKYMTNNFPENQTEPVQIMSKCESLADLVDLEQNKETSTSAQSTNPSTEAHPPSSDRYSRLRQRQTS